MISNQKLQNALNEMKEITKRDMALFNMKGKLMAHTTDVDRAMEQIGDTENVEGNDFLEVVK